MSSPDFKSLAPIIPAGGDADLAVEFYEKKLGFTTRYKEGSPTTMAIVQRGAVEILLIQNDDKHLAENTTFRIRVDGVDQLYQDYRASGVEKMTAVQIKPWGTKEFSVIDPAGVCIAFYESVK